jgi:hypothetical protein
MAKAFIRGKMVEDMKENTNLTRSMDMGYINGQMGEVKEN